MQMVAPSGPVYQAGTLSGNPVAMAAGIANLELITRAGFYEELSRKTKRLTSGVQQAADEAGVPMMTTRVGGMFGLFFTESTEMVNFAEAGQCDVEKFRVFYHHMLDRGVYLAPSAFEAGFLSSAHTEEQIEATLTAVRASLALL
jgi:glutamate-1-semialdehyde 2,1-aminomutase